LIKTDLSGNAQWNQTYGGGNYEEAFSVVQTVDGGYALAGYTASFGAGSVDFWLVKTDPYGRVPPAGYARDINVGVILAEFSDNTPPPVHEAQYYLEGSDSIASKLQRYYEDVSYGGIRLNLDFFNQSDGTWKYSLGHDRAYYGSGRGSDPSAVNNRENQFTVDSIPKADADVNFNSFDIVIVLHSGYDEAQGNSGGTQSDMWSRYFLQTLTTSDGDAVNNRIVLSEMDPMGTWAHERERACVFLKWSKMAIIPFCTFLPVLKKTVTQGNQGQTRSPNLP
jgi:hypothetical protein